MSVSPPVFGRVMSIPGTLRTRLLKVIDNHSHLR